jgi:PTH2 family peptidyl-tRNA hydrolase
MFTKQVMVVRKDLKMRKGKLASQVAHASMGVLTNALKDHSWTLVAGIPHTTETLPSDPTGEKDPVYQWFTNSYTKITTSCNSEEELDAIAKQAEEAGLPFCLITDNGTTEFNGVPTKTCVAIGPASAEDIDKITKDLKLL